MNRRRVSTIFFITVLIPESACWSSMSSVDLFVKDCFLTDMLELFLPELFFARADEVFWSAVRVHGFRNDRHERDDISVFLEEPSVTVTSMTGDAVASKLAKVSAGSTV